MMKKAMTILYEVHDNIYVNLTNKCPCSCVFCLRQTRDHMENSNVLWLEHDVTEEELRALGTGFRAPFILDVIEKASLLDELDTLSFDDAMTKLQTIKGIGPKVASCILIFSYQRREGFPLDVWMKKVMKEYYPDKDPSYFHPYEALSQQYLFSWIRNK